MEVVAEGTDAEGLQLLWKMRVTSIETPEIHHLGREACEAPLTKPENTDETHMLENHISR